MQVRQFNRILIVEDDLMLLESLQEAFGAFFEQVVVACDGASAYLALRDEKFDLVLSDMRMAGMNGIELVIRMRAEGNFVPVILTSGVMEGDDLARALKLGVRDFVPKPYNIEHLISTTYWVIEMHKREKYLHELRVSDSENHTRIRQQEKMIGLLQAAAASPVTGQKLRKPAA